MQEKEKCNIVQDLLLSYVDDILTKDSKKFVEEHFKSCKDCEEKLHSIKKDLEQIANTNQQKEIDYLKGVKNKISKKNKVIIIVTVILLIAIIINIAIITAYNVLCRTVEIRLSEDISTEELEDIKTSIISQDSTAQIIYKSKEEYLGELKKKFGEKSYLLDSYENNNIFSASLVIKVTNRKNIEDIENVIRSHSGVKSIIYPNFNPYEACIAMFVSLFNK